MIDVNELMKNVDKTYTDTLQNADEVTDTKSKDYFQNYILENFHNISPFHSTPDYSHTDGVVFNYSTDTLLTFELKKRNIPSTMFGDGLITMKKYRYLTESKERLQVIYPEIKIVNLLVEFYTDDMMVFWNIEKYISESKIRMAGVTEKTFGDRRIREVDVFVFLIRDCLFKVNDPNISKIY